MIDKVELFGLIESHFHSDLLQNEYTVESISPVSLMTVGRLDLGFKIIFLELLKYGAKFGLTAYRKNIEACNFGKYHEPGRNDKNNLESFVNEFLDTSESIKNEGFDLTKSLIPLSKNGSIANGAHRVASAIFFDKPVGVVNIESSNHIQDYKFFYGRGVDSYIVEAAVTSFIENSNNIHVAFLWPSNKGLTVSETFIPNVLYSKKISLSPNGAHNLLSQLYSDEAWIGSVSDNFRGVNEKLIKCFKRFDSFQVVAFQANALEDVLLIKDRIRLAAKVGKHSIHITDTKSEAVKSAKLVFNENSLHFLNYAKPNKYLSLHVKINMLKEHLSSENIEEKEVVMDSGMVLSAYGMRESIDVDGFTVSSDLPDSDIFENHDNQLVFHNEDKLDLIFDPKFYFYFCGLKFLSFDQVFKMKKSRVEIKDKNDILMMESFISKNGIKFFTSKINQKIYYFVIKLQQGFVNFLKIVGLYEYVRKYYRMIKGL